jgi:hypothetical protein
VPSFGSRFGIAAEKIGQVHNGKRRCFGAVPRLSRAANIHAIARALAFAFSGQRPAWGAAIGSEAFAALAIPLAREIG